MKPLVLLRLATITMLRCILAVCSLCLSKMHYTETHTLFV
jgi:hypothetical protein